MSTAMLRTTGLSYTGLASRRQVFGGIRRFAVPDRKDSTPANQPQAEARLELLEEQVRGKKSQGDKARKIPIRGQTQTKQEDNSNMAPWKEGQLFPEGWEQMSLPQKVTELYMGRRGVLFWLNKAAYASVFVLIGGWVIFRFVGPNLGLYKLAGDFQPPPF